LLVLYGGFGFHTAEIYARFGADTATFFFKVSSEALWVTLSQLIKYMTGCHIFRAPVERHCLLQQAVHLYMYTTLIPNRSMNMWARAIGGFITLWSIGDIIGGVMICRPLTRNWDFATPGTCGSHPAYYFAMGVINIITDIIMIALPMPYLYRLRLERRKKLLAMAMLSIGMM
jgi:hypothetical protein